MKNIAVHRAGTLQAEARRVVQNLLGRRLRDDEQITVMVFPPHPAPKKHAQRKAISSMEQVLDQAAANLHHVPSDSFDAAVDEAMSRVRRWK